MDTNLAFVVPYIGALPPWSALFFESCERNPAVTILLLTEHRPTSSIPPNVVVIPTSTADLLSRIRATTALPLTTLLGHKLCDFRPFFGLMFADLLVDFRFWGYCDVDMMFGDLSKALRSEVLESSDVFSANSSQCVGHFTVMRNVEKVNQLGFSIAGWRELCMTDRAEHVDEERLSEVILQSPSISWRRPDPLSQELDKKFCRFGITFNLYGDVAYLPAADAPVVEWTNGKVYYHSATGRKTEVIYVHFMGTKLPWHWAHLKTPLNHQPSSYYFSRVGYGWVTQPKELFTPRWRAVYLIQRTFISFKVAAGQLARYFFSPRVVSALRGVLPF